MNKNLPIVIAPGFFTSFWPSILNLEEKIKRLGYDVVSPKSSFLSLFNIHVQAIALSNLIDETLKKYKAEKCNVIGISMGGIVTLYYLHELDGAEKVNIFIAVGTPFQGTWSAVCGLWCAPSTWEILPTSLLIRYLLSKPKLSNVEIFNFFGSKDKLSPPESSRYKYARNKSFSGGHAEICLGINKNLLEYIEYVLIYSSQKQRESNET